MELRDIKMNISGSVMDGMGYKSDIVATKPSKTVKEYKVYPIRWLILMLFVILSAVNAIHWTQYTVIQDAVVKYYRVSSNTVYWTCMSYMVVYIPLIFPVSWIMDTMGLRVTTIAGSFATCLGSWLKVFSVSQDKFWLGFTGQAIEAIGQVFILNVPPKLAAIWFGPDQVSSACSIGVFGNQLGIAIGFVLPPIIVHTEAPIDQIGEQFQLMFYIVAGLSSLLLVVILLFFKAAPNTPPSAAADLGSKVESNYVKSIKTLLSNKNFLLLFFSYGINVGIFYAISAILNPMILKHYPSANEDVGRIGLALVVAGMVGSVLSGLVLDKTHRFKETTLVVYGASVLGMALFTFTLDCGYITVVYITTILLGFFLTGYLPVGFELGSEITYPEPEGMTSGLLNCIVQVCGIAFTLLYEWMLDTVDTRWANLALCGLLALGTGLTALIRSDLRRQAAQNKGLSQT